MKYYSGFIARITRDDVLNRIYGQRTYFIELRRDWSKGIKLIFMKKTSSTGYFFVGSGIIDRIVSPDKLNSTEKMFCVKNNYYQKIIFGQLTKYIPEINVELIIRGNWKSFAMLHGAHLSAPDVENIECLSRVSIVL